MHRKKGALVLFCGAGISVYTGLPDFRDLVKKVYEAKSDDMSSLEKEELKKYSYDRVLGLLENRHSENRKDDELRQIIKKILTVKEDTNLYLHRAILDITYNSDHESYQVVTTNFDNCFQLLQKVYNFKFDVVPRIISPKKEECDVPQYHFGECFQ